jgi:PAS domain S-box-containing protein
MAEADRWKSHPCQLCARVAEDGSLVILNADPDCGPLLGFQRGQLTSGTVIAADSDLAKLTSTQTAHMGILNRQGTLRWVHTATYESGANRHVVLCDSTAQYRMETMLRGITRAHHDFITGKDTLQVFTNLLDLLLALTDSTAGRLEDLSGPTLFILASTGEISPPSFQLQLGNGGVAVISGCAGGYSDSLEEILEPFTLTCANLIEAVRQAREKATLEDRIARLSEVSDEFFCTLDRQGRILQCNAAFPRTLGYTRDEIIGMSLWDLSESGSEAVCQSAAAQLARNEAVHGVEVAKRHKDGHTVWTSWNAKRGQADNRLTFCVGRDITVERERLERIRTMAVILERTETAVLLTDPNHLPIWANSALVRMTGLTLEEMRQSTACVGGESARAALTRGEAVFGEAHAYRKNGDEYWAQYEIRPLFGPDDQITHYVQLQNDITQRKQVELRLAEEQALLERTGQIARIGGWAYDVINDVFHVSRQIYRIHEVTEDLRFTREFARQCYHPDLRPQIRQAFDRAIAEHNPYDIESPFLTAKGRAIRVRLIGTPEIVDGRCVRLVGTLQDITERWEAEERLRLALKASGLATWTWDLTTNEILWDDAMYTLHRTPKGRPHDPPTVQPVHPPKDYRRFSSLALRDFGGQDELQFDYEIWRRRGPLLRRPCDGPTAGRPYRPQHHWRLSRHHHPLSRRTRRRCPSR